MADSFEAIHARRLAQLSPFSPHHGGRSLSPRTTADFSSAYYRFTDSDTNSLIATSKRKCPIRPLCFSVVSVLTEPCGIVSEVTIPPRSAIISSISRKLSEKRKDSQTHWLMISGGSEVLGDKRSIYAFSEGSFIMRFSFGTEFHQVDNVGSTP